MTIPTGRRMTGILLGIVATLVATYDLWVYLAVGNDATVSRVILDAARGWPVLPFAAGMVAGHFFWPQTAPFGDSK